MTCAAGACCGYNCGFDARLQPLPNLVAPKCGYLSELWSTTLDKYEPFPALLQVNKQTFMSSTQVKGKGSSHTLLYTSFFTHATSPAARHLPRCFSSCRRPSR